MNILSIGGSDPSGGAGIQGDIKTFEDLNCYGLTVVTAVTSQNTSTFSGAYSVPSSSIKNQVRSVFSDFDVSAVKVGMVLTKETAVTLGTELKRLKIPIIVDPVIKSTTAGTLLRRTALKDYKRMLLPLSYAITPNVYEASVLSGVKINNEKDLEEASHKLRKLGVKNVVITGYQISKTKIADYILDDKDAQQFLYSKKIKGLTNHGSGCIYSAALAVRFAKGDSFENAVKFAKEYTSQLMQGAKKVGRGIAIVKPKNDLMKLELKHGIDKFQRLKNISTQIPQCQTNFVYTKSNPKDLNDCLGVEGRIVRTGDSVTMAGRLAYGASKHVATALLVMNAKFPEIRSALNVKFDKKMIKKFQDQGYFVAGYDRKKEPVKVKKSSSSIEWGIKNSLKNAGETPDVIYHKGDYGKEPMILVFGETPNSIIEKLSRILNG